MLEAVESRMMLSGNIVITQQPQDQSVVAGGNPAEFSAAATGTPTPSIQWLVSTDGGNTFSPDLVDSGVTTNTLSVIGSATNNNYEYEALFTNSQGSLATSPATLSVDVPLVITREPTDQTTYAGGSATFTAAAEGSDSPITVQWQESTDGGNNFFDVGSVETFSSFTAQATYIVSNPTIDEDQDQYQAIFDNASGSSITDPATLNVTQGVAVTQQSYSQAVFPGGTATFTAAAAGLTTPSVQWFVSTNSGNTYAAVNGAVTTSSGNTTSTSLTVSSADAGDLYYASFASGSYSVQTHPGILDLDLTRFTEGDVIVIRTGDAAYPDPAKDAGGNNSNQVPVYLDEYTTAGTYVGSVAIPSSGPDALTLPGADDDEHQGNLALSTNGAILTFGGYQVPEGSDDANAEGGDDQPVIGYVYNNVNSLDTTTVVDSYGPGSDNPFFRGALTNYGNTFWTFGKYAGPPKQSQSVNGNGGLEYVTGIGPTATTSDIETYADWRYIATFNGQLYGSAGSSSVGIHGPYVVGNTAANLSSGIVTEPTTDLGQSTGNNELLGTYPGGQSASSIQMLDLPDNSLTQNGLNVMYTIGDQNEAGITKYVWNGTAWITSPYSGFNSAIDNQNYNPTGLIAVQDPTNPNWVDLTVTGQDGIYTYVDKGGAGFTGGTPTGKIPYNAFTELVAAPADGEFKGASTAPLFWEAPNSIASWNSYTKTLTVTGATGIIADPGSDEPIIQANGSAAVVTVNPTTSNQIHLGGLNLSNGASVIVTSLGSSRTATNHRVLVIGLAGTATPPLFSIDPTSSLDLSDNDLLVHDGNLASIDGLLTTGFNSAGGYWNGPGIQSSAAARQLLTALGVGQPSSSGTIDGESVNTSDVEVRYTYYGDANLDGHVDGSDYSKIDYGFTHHLAGWANGDFNYDGVVDGSDYTLIDNAFNTQSASLDAQIAAPAEQIASHAAVVPVWSNTAVSVQDSVVPVTTIDPITNLTSVISQIELVTDDGNSLADVWGNRLSRQKSL
jgi:hypothetical protein